MATLEQLFNKAFRKFVRNNQDLIKNRVSERTLCGTLAIELHDVFAGEEKYNGYFVDVEYNKHLGRKLSVDSKRIKKLMEKFLRSAAI